MGVKCQMSNVKCQISSCFPSFWEEALVFPQCISMIVWLEMSQKWKPTGCTTYNVHGLNKLRHGRFVVHRLRHVGGPRQMQKLQQGRRFQNLHFEFHSLVLDVIAQASAQHVSYMHGSISQSLFDDMSNRVVISLDAPRLQPVIRRSTRVQGRWRAKMCWDALPVDRLVHTTKVTKDVALRASRTRSFVMWQSFSLENFT